MILVLGVVDEPYADQGSETTGDVATILEDKYGLMATFAEMHESEIVESLEVGIAGMLENIAAGAPAPPDLFLGSYGMIEHEFHNYLDYEEMAGVINGVPTQAALDGKSSRFKKKKNRIVKTGGIVYGARRPSFIDTGLLRSTFKVWIEK